jgi:general secretion pathway protein C
MLEPENDNARSQPEVGNRASTGLRPASSQDLTNIPKGPAELMREFSAAPVIENGALLGFRLKALRNPNIMKEWGIRPDDVITEVNGIPLNAPDRVMVLYDKLKKQREFEITLNDGDNTRTVTVDLTE